MTVDFPSDIFARWAREDYHAAAQALNAALLSGRLMDEQEVARRALMYRRQPRPRDTSIVTFSDWLDRRHGIIEITGSNT